MNKITTCVFDAYGTLFDVNAACRELSKEVGDKWNELSSLWRLRQVEYTWLRNSMKEYIDFWKITSDALDYAMETLNIKNIKLREELLSLYLKLEAYPEVESVLENIKNLIDEILSVDECKVYKPASIVYDLVEKKMGVNKQNVLFFSSNAWDMHAASNYGFKTIWVNRFDSTLEKLPGKPDQIINSLEHIEKILKN